MTEFVYMLSYNAMGQSPSDSQIQLFIQQNRDINTWYFAFFGTYIFKSDKSLVELAPQFRAFFGNAPCVLSYLNPTLVGGSLPQIVWDWINASRTQQIGDLK